jgi:hypothetical protein
VSFRNEINFYKNIFPILQSFQREHHLNEVINCFPKYYGSRLNLSGITDKVDSDAFLLLENLKPLNFVNLERTEGFDLEVTKLVIGALAEMHAVALALKLKKPEVFAEKVRKDLRTMRLSDDFSKSIERNLHRVVDSVEELRPFLDRIRKIPFSTMYPPNTPREPFATISHNDCWVNNVLVQRDIDGRPVKVKLVDFQIADYGSPAKDVLFLIFTSVKERIVVENYDELIELYYENFTALLRRFECDLEPFSRQAFEEELKYEAKNSQFCHVLLMLFPIFAPKGSVMEISDLKPSDIGSGEPTELHRQKLIFVVEQFVKRNWI